VGAAIVLALSGPSVARAATEGLRVDGSASGQLATGGRLVLRIDAVEVGGSHGLDRVDVSLVVAGEVVETIAYDVEAHKLAIGAEQVFAGTGGSSPARTSGSVGRRSSSRPGVRTSPLPRRPPSCEASLRARGSSSPRRTTPG